MMRAREVAGLRLSSIYNFIGWHTASSLIENTFLVVMAAYISRIIIIIIINISDCSQGWKRTNERVLF